MFVHGWGMTAEYLNLESQAVHAGREDLNALGVHALPLDLSTTNPLPDIDHGGDSYECMATGGHPLAAGGNVYARLWNPTVARFEVGLAVLERAEAAVAFASGMAAITAAILASKPAPGTLGSLPHIVAVRPLYGGTDHLLASGLLGNATQPLIPAQNWDDTRVLLPFALCAANCTGLFAQGAVTPSNELWLSTALKAFPVNLFIEQTESSGASR